MRRLLSRLGGPAPAVLLLLFTTAGCGGYHAVHGTVTLDDGTPVTKGMVVFEATEGEKPVSARGQVGPDGHYELSTAKPGDGVPAGKYRVLIAPQLANPDAPEPLPYDRRYTDFKTSGLEFEVKSGQTEYPIRLTRAPKGR